MSVVVNGGTTGVHGDFGGSEGGEGVFLAGE